MSEKPNSKWYWRLLRWGLIGMAVLVTLAALLITEENWRGQRDWENYKALAAARGEPLDQSAALASQIPDEQNFAKARVFSALWAMKWDEKEQSWEPGKTAVDPFKMATTRSDGSWPKEPRGDWETGALMNLKVWQTYYRTSSAKTADEFRVAPQPQSPAADVLLALRKYDSAVEAWRLASQRPYARFSDNYDASDSRTLSLLLNYLGKIKAPLKFLQLRAVAELANGQSDEAFDDVKLMLKINDALRQEPVLIAHLVSLASMSLALQPIYEGLANHRWSDAQLAELEKEIAAKDFLADYQKAMRGKRAFAIGFFENLRHTRQYQTSESRSNTNNITTVSFRLMPAAFFYQNELATARLSEEYCLPLVNLGKRVVSPTAVHRAEAAVQGELSHYNPYKTMALESYPAISKSVEKFASVQANADLARVACALERYRLAQGDYPAALDVLAPQYLEKLPHDIINGDPLNYRRTDGGNFILYSVGWNEKDDDGQVALTKNGAVDRERGDWVWNSAAK